VVDRATAPAVLTGPLEQLPLTHCALTILVETRAITKDRIIFFI
jgi:hypothetical protein